MIDKKKYKYLKFEKLIRDGNPRTIKNLGGECFYHNLTKDELIANLKLKLIEEAKEVLDAKNIDEIVDEIGDVVEVLKTLIKVAKIRKFSIWKARRKKAKFRGRYEKGVYCKYVKFPGDITEKWMHKYEDITEQMEKQCNKNNKKGIKTTNKRNKITKKNKY